MRRTIRLLVCGLAAIGVLQVVITVTPITRWWSWKLSGGFDGAKGDVLIVLAASSLEDGTLIDSSYWRCLFAVWAWREGGFQKIILSGGGNGVPAAEAMRHFMVVYGVPETALILESQSRNTRENAVEVRRLLGNPVRKPVLLTSDYHMFRARRAFESAGLAVVPRPIPDGARRGSTWWRRWSVFQELLIETAKIGYYRARGWI